MTQLSDDFFHYIAQTSPESIALEVERAEGVYLYTPEGRRIIDLISGICVSNVGHRAPEVVAAICEQAERYLHPMVYGEAVMSPQVRYAQRLIELLGPGFDKVYFTNSGAEAIEGALKVAKKYTGRSRLLACWKSYHGSTHGALSITGSESMKRGYGPLLPDVDFLHYNSFEDLDKIDTDTAAVVIEAIQGGGGYVLPAPGYLEAVRQRCDETGALMILDEIQTAFGRSGKLFAFQHHDFRPDILVLAKALGGGMPLGAFITRDEVMEVIQRNPVLGFITTFGGHPVSCAAGLAALEKLLNEDLMAQVPAKEALIRKHLRPPGMVELRGKGLMWAAIFPDFDTAERIRIAALERGIMLIGFLNIDNGLRIAPPLTITEEELREACESISK